jgi:acetyl esterase
MKTLLLVSLTFALTACGATSTSLAQDAIPEEPTVQTYREVDGQALQAYIFSPTVRGPDAGPVSAILLFHGGGWSIGTPEWTFEAAQRFAAHGMVAIPIQYRLSEGDVTPIEALSDVCAAFRWAREHADNLGLDPELTFTRKTGPFGKLAFCVICDLHTPERPR